MIPDAGKRLRTLLSPRAHTLFLELVLRSGSVSGSHPSVGFSQFLTPSLLFRVLLYESPYAVSDLLYFLFSFVSGHPPFEGRSLLFNIT